MADGAEAASGSGGPTFATDQRASDSHHFPLMKLAFGPLDTFNVVGSTSSNPFPVALSDTDNAVLDNILNALQLIDDAVFADDAAFTAGTSKVLAIGAMADETTPDSVDEGDVGIPRMSLRRELYVQLRDAAGNERGLDVDANGDVGVTNAALTELAAAINSSRVDVNLAADGVGLALETGGNLATVAGAVHVEDTAHSSGHSGAMALAVRRDADTSLVGTDGDYAPLQVDQNGYLKVEIFDGGGSHTVDNAGTFAVQVDAALPAGTNAIGKLAANSGVDIGDVDILSVIPGTGATNLGKAEDAAHTTGDVGVMALAVRQDSQVDFGADGDYVPLSIDANGALRVTGGGGGTEYTEDAAAATDPVGGAVILVRADTPATITSTDGDNVAQRGTNYGAAYCQIVDSSGNFIDTFGGSGGTAATDDAAFTAGTGQGTPAMGFFSTDTVNSGDVGVLAMDASRRLFVSLEVDNVGLATETTIASVLTAVQLIDDAIYTDDDDWTDTTSKHMLVGGLYQSSPQTITDGDVGPIQVDSNGRVLAKLAANSGVDIGDVDVLSIAAGSNLIGDVGLSGARTSGGTTLYKNIDVDESEDEVKGSAGQVYWIHCMNLSNSVRYLKLYNATAATVVVGTTTPDLTFPIPTQGDTNGAGFVVSIPNGIAFGTAITVAATTGVADNDSGAPGANEVVVNLGYA